MKLKSWSDKPFLIISQSPHGNNQNGKAMDFAHLKGNAPAPGKVIQRYPQSDPQLNYFTFGQDNWELQCVHTDPVRPVGSSANTGEPLWKSTWNHVHLTIKISSKWEYALSCLDWDSVPVYWLKEGQKHPVWTNKSTYPSIELPPYPIQNTEMVNLQLPIKCVSTNTVDMNIRKEPTTKSEAIGKMPPSTPWQTQKVARGEAVEGVDTWYGFSGGFVSGKYVRELVAQNNAELEQKVTALTLQNKQLTDNNATLTKTNEKYKPGYDAAILINQVQT